MWNFKIYECKLSSKEFIVKEDDLLSLSYSLIYLFGILPWKTQRYKKEIKKIITKKL